MYMYKETKQYTDFINKEVEVRETETLDSWTNHLFEV